MLTPSGHFGSTRLGLFLGLVNFAAFGRLSAPPTPAPATATTLIGQQVFNQIGCNMCHTPTINSGSTFYGTGLTMFL